MEHDAERLPLEPDDGDAPRQEDAANEEETWNYRKYAEEYVDMFE